MLERNTEANLEFEIIVNGKIVAKRASHPLAEAYILSLSESEQSHASIRPVTKDGKQLLLD